MWIWTHYNNGTTAQVSLFVCGTTYDWLCSRCLMPWTLYWCMVRYCRVLNFFPHNVQDSHSSVAVCTCTLTMCCLRFHTLLYSRQQCGHFGLLCFRCCSFPAASRGQQPRSTSSAISSVMIKLWFLSLSFFSTAGCSIMFSLPFIFSSHMFLSNILNNFTCHFK